MLNFFRKKKKDKEDKKPETDLEAYLDEKKIWHRFIDKPQGKKTEKTAEATGIDIERLTKTLVILDDKKEPLIAIIPGNRKLSYSKLRKRIGSKKVRWIESRNAQSYTGYPPGATPMVYHKMNMKVVLDKSLSHYHTIYGGGGTTKRIVEMLVDDVIRLNEADIADICDD